MRVCSCFLLKNPIFSGHIISAYTKEKISLHPCHSSVPIIRDKFSISEQ